MSRLRSEPAIERAIKAAGGIGPLAKALGVSYQAVQKYRARIPAERVIAIELATGISRHQLRPDIYPPSEAA